MLKVAEHAGFCFGVNRAINTIDSMVSQGKRVCTLGPIIHNPQIIKNMETSGVTVVHDIADVKPGVTLVIRSHGISKKVLENIKARKIPYIDATCPFVKKIHDIVQKNSSDGNIIFIAGDENHPEVQGIVGHCEGKWFIFKNSDELLDIIKMKVAISAKVCVVAQTTFSVSEWEKCLSILKKAYTNLKIFDTICATTTLRQNEAENLSKDSDLMIIIGGKNSSNTAKLYEICKKNCESYHIETKSELPLSRIKKSIKIGITAGASTPACIIEEAAKVMNEVLKKENRNEESVSFEQMLEESLNSMDTNNRVKGIVMSVAPNEVCVDVGRKQSGFIPASELSSDPTVNPDDIVSVGDEIDLLIMKTNDQDGTIMLSKKRVDALKGWDEIVKAKDENTVLTGKIVDVVKGGIIAISNGSRVFIPASQASNHRIENLDELKGENVEFRIIDVNPSRRRAVGSIKAVLNEEKMKKLEKFWGNINVGDTCEGTVKSFTNYGAFVDLGGIDGMVHISELSWNRVKHPSDVLSVGQKIRVTIKDLDKEKGKISLIYKDASESPWEKLKKDYPIGSIVDAKIVGITQFGAFANILPGIDGLIHISQISNEHIEKIQEVLSVGDIVKAKITDIDFDKMRVSLSMKATLENEMGNEPIQTENAE